MGRIYSAKYLAEPPMPKPVYERVAGKLRQGSYRLAQSPVDGRLAALKNTQIYSKKRWHRSPQMLQRLLLKGKLANLQLAQVLVGDKFA
jgi:hypothetical protein